MFRLVYLCLQMDPAHRPKGEFLEVEVKRCCVDKGPESAGESTQPAGEATHLSICQTPGCLDAIPVEAVDAGEGPVLASVRRPASPASTIVAVQDVTTLDGVQQPAQKRYRVQRKSAPPAVKMRANERMAKETSLKSPNSGPSMPSLLVGSGAELPSALEPASVNKSRSAACLSEIRRCGNPCACSGNCGSQQHYDRVRKQCTGRPVHKWLCKTNGKQGKRFAKLTAWSGDTGCVNCTCRSCLQRPRYRSFVCKSCNSTASGSRSGGHSPGLLSYNVIAVVPATVAPVMVPGPSEARENNELFATISVASPRLPHMWPSDVQAYLQHT